APLGLLLPTWQPAGSGCPQLPPRTERRPPESVLVDSPSLGRPFVRAESPGRDLQQALIAGGNAAGAATKPWRGRSTRTQTPRKARWHWLSATLTAFQPSNFRTDHDLADNCSPREDVPGSSGVVAATSCGDLPARSLLWRWRSIRFFWTD